jgi:hypothetical protein
VRHADLNQFNDRIAPDEDRPLIATVSRGQITTDNKK